MRWTECLVIGAAGGLMAGLLGVGGGLVMVPMLMAFLKMGIHDAKAQSLGIIMISAISGTVKSWQVGRIEWPVVLVCGLSAAVFSPLGVSLGERLPRETLLRAFACLMIVMGIKYLVNPSDKKPPVEHPAVAQAPAEH